MRLSDRTYNWMAYHFFSTLGGMKFGSWWNLLRENRFAVAWPFWPRAGLVSLASLYTSGHQGRDARLYGDALETVAIPPPVIILGHYRAGTTHLHNLLSLDPRFAFPTLYQSFFPLTFLSLESRLSPGARRNMGRRRPQDNVPLGGPTEDEHALGILTSRSPYLSWVFPRRREVYDRYMTFEGVPDDEVEVWKAGFLFYMRKLTWVYQRPLILKSPPHTARIRLLLELFPGARFVHIHRNPYDVFRSTKHLFGVTSAYFLMQRTDGIDSDDRVIEIYNAMYDAFFDQRRLIPPGQYCEVGYEELEREPEAQVEAIYSALALPDFEVVRPALRDYLATITGYQKNRHADLPGPLRERVAREWRRGFDTWGYDVGA